MLPFAEVRAPARPAGALMSDGTPVGVFESETSKKWNPLRKPAPVRVWWLSKLLRGKDPPTEKKGRHMNATDTDQIRELLTTYQDALNASDAETATSLYGADGVFLPYQLPTSSGDEIIGAYQAIFSAIRLDIAFTIDDVTVDGDTAHALTRSKGNVTVLADGTITPEENRELFVFERRDGQWKIVRYMFNKTSAEPPTE